MTPLYDLQKILLVEDHDLVVRDIRNSLESLGYSLAAVVPTIDAASEAMTQRRHDLVLMNFDMLPGTEEAQRFSAQCSVPIVALITNTDAATMAKISAVNPLGVVIKPYDCEILGMKIELAMTRCAQEQAMQQALTLAQTQAHKLQDQITQNLEYVAMAAHDLRNPLGVVRSVAEVLTSMGDQLSAERRTRYLQRMLSATENLDELLQSILTYSYVRAGRLDAPPSKIDLVQFCQTEIANLTQDGQNYFCFQPQSASCSAYLNCQMLSPLLMNLLDNALKYSPYREALIQVSLNWDAENIELTVRDRGLGIPLQNQAQIFEPFFRGENVGELPGAGLGLAIAQECADRQGGSIQFSSTISEGSCFTLVLPRDSRLSIEL